MSVQNRHVLKIKGIHSGLESMASIQAYMATTKTCAKVRELNGAAWITVKVKHTRSIPMVARF